MVGLGDAWRAEQYFVFAFTAAVAAVNTVASGSTDGFEDMEAFLYEIRKSSVWINCSIHNSYTFL